uniref:Uncharacterized protein n=1 Tax=Solanum tuberosum TaxID=4113 RepID=M1DWK6_SOLTU
MPRRSIHTPWMASVGQGAPNQAASLDHGPTTRFVNGLTFLKICAAKDHSAQLFGIADAFGDPPFGLLHRLSAFAFNIFAFWIIGQYSTASRICSAMCRLLPFIANLIFSFKAQHTGTLGEVKAIRRLA